MATMAPHPRISLDPHADARLSLCSMHVLQAENPLGGHVKYCRLVCPPAAQSGILGNFSPPSWSSLGCMIINVMQSIAG